MPVGDHTPRTQFSLDGKKVVTAKGANVIVWTVDPQFDRTFLWRQSADCLPPTERQLLLGETNDEARDGFGRCQDVVERCRPSFDACSKAISEILDH
jgi:hypothetical protein